MEDSHPFGHVKSDATPPAPPPLHAHDAPLPSTARGGAAAGQEAASAEAAADAAPAEPPVEAAVSAKLTDRTPEEVAADAGPAEAKRDEEAAQNMAAKLGGRLGGRIAAQRGDHQEAEAAPVDAAVPASPVEAASAEAAADAAPAEPPVEAAVSTKLTDRTPAEVAKVATDVAPAEAAVSATLTDRTPAEVAKVATDVAPAEAAVSATLTDRTPVVVAKFATAPAEAAKTEGSALGEPVQVAKSEGSALGETVEVAETEDKALGQTVEVSLDVTVFAAKAPVGATKSLKSQHEDSESDFDSDADDGFQVGTLSIKQDMSRVYSLRPLDPIWGSSRNPSTRSSLSFAEAEAPDARGQAAAVSSSTSLRTPEVSQKLSIASRRSSGGASQAKNVRHKFSRSSFGESSEDSDSSIVADLPSKPPTLRSLNISSKGAAAGSDRVAASRFASVPAPRGASGFQEVRAVASLPTRTGDKVVFHKQATGRRLACTSSSLQAAAQASLSNQDMPLEGNNSIKAQVEAMQLEEMQRQWSQYDREKGDQPTELAACGTDGCAVS